jgi:hypothetical protein
MNSHIKNHPNIKPEDNILEVLKDVLIPERE